MANNIYQDLLRQTQEEIARKGTQAQEQERNRRQQAGIPSVQIKQTPASKSIIGTDASAAGIAAGNTAVNAGVASAADFLMGYANQDQNQPKQKTSRDYAVELGQINTDLYWANKFVKEYKSLRDGYGMSGEEEDERLRGKMNQLLSESGFSSLAEAEKRLEELQTKKYNLENERKYIFISENPDFDEMSKRAHDSPTVTLFSGDPTYDYINDLDGKKQFDIELNAAVAHAKEPLNGDPFSLYSMMDDSEIAVYNYLYNKEGKKSADGYLKYITPELNARVQGIISEDTKKFAHDHHILASLVSTPVNLLSGIGGLDAFGQKIENDIKEMVTGQYQGPIDPNTPGMSYSHFVSDVRGQRASDLADKYGRINLKPEKHPILSRILNGRSLGDLYQLGMSMGDSAINMLLVPVWGKAGTALLAGSAGTSGMLKSLEEGATDDQAIAMGVLNGAAEFIFEKYELENLLGMDAKGLKAVLNQGLTEAFGEGFTTIANTISDVLVMQDRSEFMENVKKYSDRGMSRGAAVMNAFFDAAIETGWDALFGFISGGAFGGMFQKVNGTTNTNEQQTDVPRSEGTPSGDNTGTVTPEGQQSDLDTQPSGPVQTSEQDGPQPQNQPTPVGDQISRAIQYLEANGTVSNSMAEKILADPEALARLQKMTGMELPGTKSGNRAAVKNAISQLFAESNPVSGDSVSETGQESTQTAAEQAPPAGKPAPSTAPQNANVNSALDYYKQNGRVSNSVAEAVLADPAAVQELQQLTGTNIPGVMEGATHTQKRNAVKGAIAQLTVEMPGMSQQGAVDTFVDSMQELQEENTGTAAAPEQTGLAAGTELDAAISQALQGKSVEPTPGINNQIQLSETAKEAGPAPDVEPPKNGSLATPTSPASDNSVQTDVAEANGNPEEHGAVGAAERNFSGKADYQELLYEGNVQRDRPGDVRPMEVPKKDSYGRNVSEFVGNAYGADVTPDSMASEIEMLVQEGALGFDKKTNHEAIQDAAQAIREKGPMATMKSITKSISNGKLRDGDIEKAMLLYARYANMDFEKNPDAKDYASELMVDLTTMAHMSGRNLQLFSMFRRMAPEGQLMTVQKTIQRSVENLIKNGKVKNDYVPSIESQLQENYLKAAREAQKAKTPGDVEAARQKLKAAENAIILSEAAKIPATFKAKWDAWRYMGMLGNAKTQIRNVAGNAAYIPYKAAKDAIGAAMELAIPKEQRTKAIMNLASKADRDLLSWAMADGKSGQVQDALKYSAKLGDDVSGDVIRQNMRIFNTEALEAVRKAVEWAPSFGDMVFKNHYYANSLAGFLKARGYSIQDVMDGKVSDGVFQEARSYAIQEAMKATFNDCNAFSDFIVNLRYKGDNPVGKAMNLLGEGVIPFRRTPANIVVRAVDNSPVSIVRGAVNLATKVRNGQMSAATAIDQMASGLTGSGAMLLGFALASGILGIKLRGSGTDDDEKRRGIQDYSIEFSIGGKDYSYTIDWAAPANLPLFVGANIYEAFNEREWDTGISKFSKVIYAMGDTLEPMLSLSCLSSLNDIIESSRYAEDNKAIITVLSQAAFSYFTQGVPALLRQTVQAAHQNKQITFANNQDPLLREAERKIGGVALLGEFFRTDKINQWGETESAGGGLRRIIDAYFNPGTLKEIDTSDLESEIERLNSSQPDSVSPPDAAKTITYTDASGNRHENYRMTAEEYSTLASVQGATARSILEEIISSESYDTFTDAQRAKVFGYVYDYAREKGRIAAIDGYTGNLASWMEDADGGEAGAVIRKVIESDFSDAFSDLADGGDNAAEALGRAYDGYKGLSFDDKKIFRENATGRVKWMIDAGAAGMDAETFAGMYQQYRDIDGSDKGISQKANAWAYALQNAYERGDITKKQMQALKKDMVFRYSGVVDTPKFDSMVEAGISGGDAKKVVDLLAGLKPESGYKSVRDIQNAEAIVNSGLSNGDTVEALYAYLPNSQDENLREMLDMGFSAQDYVAAWRLYDSESGEGKKRRTIDSYRSMFDVDYETAKMIYEIYG